MGSFDAHSGVWAIVPVKRFGLAKRRLASVLTRPERSRLARAMLCDVLGALTQVHELCGVVVVTGDPVAADLARSRGCRILDDAAETGTNPAVQRAIRVLAGEERRGILVLPGDVPLTTAPELRRVLAAMADRSLVLVPAADDGGTNLLAASPPDLVETYFGPGSFERHMAAARAAGVEPAVLRLEGIGRDIDRPNDLPALLACARSTRARAFLEAVGAAARLNGAARRGLGG